MKIICLQEKLKKAISIVERVTGKNINLPILSNILIETDKGRLKVSATDLEIGLTTWVSAKVDEDGKITVPVGVLSNFVSSLPQDKVSLESEKHDLMVKCNNFNANIKGMSAEDFPIIPKIEENPLFIIKSRDFHKALSQVHQAASFSDTRPEISGVLFKITQQGDLKLVATDSFRLAEKVMKKALPQQNQEISLIIPLKTIIELTRILSDIDKDIKITIKENQILFDIEDIQLISRLIEGHFPDYERIIPQEFQTEVVVEKDKLIEAIKIASFFVTKVNDINLSFSNKGLIEISSKSQELGEHNSSIKAEVKGEDVKLVFNYRYLIDGLNNTDKNKVILRANGKERPLLMKSATDNSYTYIAMPVRDTE
ncbi:MAG: DNA polymerase III subunit beta [Candidatus Paceibacterota bacterium]|jgi:DNA polymerase-3 subunit beta